MDLYKFGWERAQEQNEELYSSIEGLSPEESALAIKTLEAEDKEEHEEDREAEDLEEDDGNIPEGEFDFV